MDRQKEAKWLSDLETLKKHYSKFKRTPEGFLIKDTKQNAEGYMRVSIENSDKYVDMENEKIRKEKKDNEMPIKEKVWELLLRKKKPEATELIVEDLLENNSIYTIRNDEKDEMWIYNEGIYIPNGQSYIKERCDEILGVASTTNLCNQIIFKIETRTYINQEEFFKEEDKDLIAVQNGILNVKTKEIFPFNPKYRFFNKLPMDYKPEAKCDAIIKFFQSTLKDEKEIKVIQEMFGFLLYREYFLEKAFMFLGGGRNGKGKTIDLMKRFLGLNNCAEISLEALEKDMYSLEELFKKMANLSGDLSRSALRHTGNFKKLTGRDLVSGARKFKTRVHFENYSKMIFACNELPVTYDITTAFFNRWIIIDFPYTFLTQKEIDKEENKANLKLQDPEIINKIVTKEELEGLLVWALVGLDRLFVNKSFSLSPSTEETKVHWLRKSDSFQGFIMDCLEEDYESHITKQDLKKEYAKYCKSHKLRISNDKVIKALIETILGGWEERIKIGENQKACWFGLKLKEIDKNEVDKSKGSKGSKGILSLAEKVNSPRTSDTLVSPASLTFVEDKEKTPFDKFSKSQPKKPEKPQFSAEDIKKSGIDPEILKKAGVSIPEMEHKSPPEPLKTNDLSEKEEFKKKMGEFGF